MKGTSLLVAALVVTTAVPADAVAAENEPPLVDAGLDQTVERGSTVLLDGTGSRDPDGRVASYRWSITSPDGRSVSPENASAPETSFEATRRGRYEVRLTVVDDDGASRADTLYVTVEKGERPAVSVSGPTRPRVGSERTYTASLDSGAAPLDRLVWIVDGTVVANRTLADEQSTDTLSTTFGTVEEHNVTAVVHDADGLSASDALAVTTRSRPAARDSRSRPPDDSVRSLAARYSPSVSGARVVTGSEPLTANYEVTGVNLGDVRSVTWHSETGRIGRGSDLGTSWSPGDHRLYAVVAYRDGSRDVARFSDGTTRVVADPAPTLSLDELDPGESITGRATAFDGYENLEEIRVRIGGETVGRWSNRGSALPNRNASRRSLPFRKDGVALGDEYDLVVTAVDARGQTARIERSVTPTAAPEIVESGFVNTPVDSYHERIDPDRYVAKHVMKIDLNGVERDSLVFSFEPGKSDIKRINKKEVFPKRDGDKITVTTEWAAKKPGVYTLKSIIEAEHESGRKRDSSIDILAVEQSPPELRLEVTYDGTPHQKTAWGIRIDAGDSFDPDGTDLKYIWGYGARPTRPDNTTAKFDSMKFASITIVDEYGNSVTRDEQFHQYYAPEIESIEPVEEGPYAPNDTVQFRVKTKEYEFSKNTYNVDLSLDLEGVSGRVEKWKRFKDDITDDAQIHRRWEGIVSIPAEELQYADGARIKVYSTKKPDQAYHYGTIPSVTVLRDVGTVRRNVTVSDLRYVLDKPKISRVYADSTEERDQYLSEGYDVERVHENGYKITVDKRVKVRDPVYETRTKSFSNPSNWRQFLRLTSEWKSAGTKRSVREWTGTDTEWRDSRTGSGTFTGQTRKVMVEPPEYRVKKQYRYTRTVTKTGWRTVMRPKRVTVREERTRKEWRCRFGYCYRITRTYTVPVQKTIWRPVTQTYTYTTTESDTYWAFNKYGSDHRYTGRSKRVKVADARYDTQYKYEFEKTYRETETTYLAERQVMVEPAKYEWREHATPLNRLRALDMAQRDGYRIGSIDVDKEWELTKTVGRKRVMADSYDDEDRVIKTRATVYGLEEHRLFNAESGKYIVKNESVFRTTVEKEGVASKSEIINEVKQSEDGSCVPLRSRVNRGGCQKW
ncbi:PKD domain-containing protein [Halegenticoccus soli]|uniref:PKD domain-containing protein n=1 Tax=Halegenticoccus soli TaxID=1985678 RepID=UPI000C6E9EFE|nr:PKD domain-containing protein [Halegenticoccus soli]